MKKRILPLFTFLAALIMCAELIHAQDTEAPPAPGELTLVEKTHNSVTFSWDNVSSTGGMMGYLVYVDGAQESDTVKLSSYFQYVDHYPELREFGNNSDYRTLQYTAYDLEPSTTYSFEVAAIDSALNISSKSPALEATTEANAPDGITVLYPTDDANIIGGTGNFMTFNTGDWPMLLLNTHENFDGWHTASRPIIKFDISGIDGTINSAKLRMYGGLYEKKSWQDEQSIYSIKVAFYEVGTDWDEESIVFATVPEEDIGADLEGNPQKDAMTNKDTLMKYTPVSYTVISNDPAVVGVPAPTDNNNIQFAWFDANFKPYLESEILEGSSELSFTMVDTTFNKFSYFRFFSEEGYTNRLQLEIEGDLTSVENTGVLSNSMQLYPNPVADHNTITISLSETGNYDIEFIDIIGRKVYTTVLSNARTITINTNGINVRRGVYFVRATKDTGESGIKRLIIQ
jgi:chitodextrinase